MECTLLDLPSDCILQIVLRVPPSNFGELALVSKQFKKALDNKILKKALFFHKFGPDYWGETVGLHPYKNVPREIDIFDDLCLGDILYLLDRVEKDPNSDPDIKRAIAHTIELGSTYTWVSLYKNQQNLIKMWEKPCNSAFLVAGLPNSGKSTVLNLIMKKKNFELIQKSESFDTLKIVRGSVQALTYLGEESEVDTHDINICEIAKPRNWYPTFRKSQHHSLVAKPTKKKFTEFHGMLGESAASKFTTLGLVLSKQGLPNAASMAAIMDYLKVVPAQAAPGMGNCPFYAGPVTIAVMGETDLLSENAAKVVSHLIHFMLMQPSSRPHFSIRKGGAPMSLKLAKLVDRKDGYESVPYRSSF